MDLPLTISSLRMSNLSTKSTLTCMILPRYNNIVVRDTAVLVGVSLIHHDLSSLSLAMEKRTEIQTKSCLPE